MNMNEQDILADILAPFTANSSNVYMDGRTHSIAMVPEDFAPGTLLADVLNAANAYRHCKLQGDIADVLEDSNGMNSVPRSSDSWYTEASEYEEALFASIEALTCAEQFIVAEELIYAPSLWQYVFGPASHPECVTFKHSGRGKLHVMSVSSLRGYAWAETSLAILEALGIKP
jgi:hypothetical protein